MGRVNGPQNIFRNNGKKYYAQLIGHDREGEKFTSPDGSWHTGLAMFVIKDELQENELGGVMFTAGPLVKAVWNNFDQTSKDYFDTVDDATAVLVNLLNYLPLDLASIPEWFHGKCFEYRFNNQAQEGKDPTRPIFNIDSRDGIQKNIRRWVLGDNFTTQDALEAMKKVLWNLYEINPDVGVTFNRFARILGLGENVVKGYMRRLVDAGLAKVSSGTDQEPIIAIKATYDLVDEMEGGVKKKMTGDYNDNRQYIVNVRDITAKDGGAIAFANVGDVKQEFENIMKQVDEIEDLSPEQKEEVKGLVTDLDNEMKGTGDQNKVVGILKKIASISAKAVRLVTDNSTMAPFLVHYLAEAAKITL